LARGPSTSAGSTRIVFRDLAFIPSDATAEEIAKRDAWLDVDLTVDEDVEAGGPEVTRRIAA